MAEPFPAFIRHYRYVTLRIDKAGGERKAILTFTKGQASSAICKTFMQWQTVLESKVKRIQTDGAKELSECLVGKIAEENGTVIMTPPENTAAMNGNAERSVKTLRDCVEKFNHIPTKGQTISPDGLCFGPKSSQPSTTSQLVPFCAARFVPTNKRMPGLAILEGFYVITWDLLIRQHFWY